MAPIAHRVRRPGPHAARPRALGVVLAARTIPLIVFMLVGGVVADRFSRSPSCRCRHLLSAATQGTVAVLLLTGTCRDLDDHRARGLNGTVAAFTFPAMQGVVPQVVPRSHIQQANAMLGFSRSGSRILGPAIGGILVVTVGSGWAVADRRADLGGGGGPAWPASGCLRGRPERRASQPPMWRDLVEGWSAFTSMTWVWVVVVAFGVPQRDPGRRHAHPRPGRSPKDTIGKAGWGWVLSAEAAGLLVMTVVMIRWRLTLSGAGRA